MVFRIGQLLERGKFNWKGLKNILHDHEARLDALESIVNGLETNTYYFKSFDDDKGTTLYGEGTAESTGVVTNGYLQIEVKTNSTDQSFVGQKFFIVSNAKADGTTYYQLYSDAGTTAINIYVLISKEAFE